MAISETNIKLLKPENVSDFVEGGGRMTINAVVDGEVNNLFDDISGLDRANGRVSLRKTFLSIQTDTTDRYLGAHVIVTNAPEDNDVSALMFSTESWTDTRQAAQNRVESYTTLGAQLEWVLMGTHARDQKLLQLFSVANATTITSPISADTPQIGDVIVLSVEADGYTPAEQYVRVSSIKSRQTQSFFDTAEFFKDVLILEISDPLQQDFVGVDPVRVSKTGCPTLVRSTLVSDIAQYYGVKAITSALVANDVVVQIDSPYERLAPSTTAESPLVDVPVNSARANYIQASAVNDLQATLALGSSAAPDYVDYLYLGRGILPGSLTLTIGGVVYKDDRLGAIILTNGNLGAYTGTVDYASGGIQISGATVWAETVVAVATQAVVTYDSSSTLAIDVTINNRGFTWVETLRPIPTAGTLTISYRALNRWYTLYDNGNGHLAGKGVDIGTATVSYSTGGVSLTTKALPDVDTQIIFAWATPIEYTRQTYSGQTPIAEVRITLANTPVVPGSLDIAWQQNGVSKSASVADDGTISGDATGRLVAATGDLRIKPNVLPTSGTTFTLNYDQSELVNDVFALSGDGSGVVTTTLTQHPVKP
ncbi:MAG: hypothetical protein PHU14_03220 [Methylovulum sp.]|nr:hypothetical protein [Methylovulum sp.]